MINSYKKIDNKKKLLNLKSLTFPLLIFSQLVFISFCLYLGGGLYRSGVLSYWKDDLNKVTKDIRNNFASIFLSDLPKYKINLDFVNLRKLQISKLNAIKYGIGNFNNSKYVDGILKINNNPLNYDLKIRLKGVGFDNFRHSSSWSFKIKTKEISPTINNVQYNLQHTNTRSGIVEYAFQKFLKSENLISHRINLVDLILNKKSLGSYYIIDGYSKYFIEANKRREGLIFEYDKSNFVEHLSFISKDKRIFKKFLPDTFKTSEVRTLKGTKPEKFPELKSFGENKLRSFQSGELNFSEAFEYKDAAKIIAIRAIFGSTELDWRDMKFYLNPITMKLELISREIHTPGGDGTITYPQNWWYIDPNKPLLDETDFISKLNKDREFMKSYVSSLNYYSKKEVLDKLFNINNDIFILDNKINNFTKSKLNRKAIYRNANFIREELNKKNKLNIFNAIHFIENGDSFIKLFVTNLINFPIEIDCISSKNNMRFCLKDKIIYPNKNKPQELVFISNNKNNPSINNENIPLKISYNVFGLEDKYSKQISLVKNIDSDKVDFYNIKDLSKEETSFSIIDFDKKLITFTKTNLILNQPYLIPSEFKLVINNKKQKIFFNNNSFLLVKGGIEIVGDKNYPIYFSAIDGSSGGIIIMNSKYNSLINHAEFNKLSVPESPYKNITGALTIYNSPISILNSKFKYNKDGDDYINAIRSEVQMSNLTFNNVLADAIDLDFCKGFISNLKFTEINNDAIDFSGSKVEVKNIFASYVKDKVISAGEESFINIINLEAENSNTVIASKDSSIVKVKDINSKNNQTVFAAYNKKPEFKGGIIYTNLKPISDLEVLKDKISNILYEYEL